jgi:hypothetical protein
MQYQLKRVLQIKIHLKDILAELDLWHSQCVEGSGREGAWFDDACLVDLQRILRKSIKFQKRFQKRHEEFHKLCARQTIAKAIPEAIPEAMPEAANKVLQSVLVSYAFLKTFIANLTKALCSELEPCRRRLEPWRVRVIIEQTEQFMDSWTEVRLS